MVQGNVKGRETRSSQQGLMQAEGYVMGRTRHSQLFPVDVVVLRGGGLRMALMLAIIAQPYAHIKVRFHHHTKLRS